MSESEAERPKITVSKIEAAKRQLDCAIELWFRGGDEVSIHTLATAAYQIIYDVNKHRKTAHVAIYNAPSIKDEFRSVWFKAVRTAMTFFKHADRDPDPNGTIEFSLFGNIVFFLSCVTGFAHLDVDQSDYETAFMLWIQLHKPELILKEARDMVMSGVPADGLRELRDLDKEQFLEAALDGMRRARLPSGSAHTFKIPDF